jgi:hypothetical protein
MQTKLEAGHNPEVAAAASQCPEEIWIRGVACPQQAAIGGHNIGGFEVIDA